MILAELPLGQADYDIRSMFYSIVHHGRLLNGYSGFFPAHYGLLALTLSDVPSHTMSAWDALRSGGATIAGIVRADPPAAFVRSV